MPGDKVFIDTNVLLYLHDRRDPKKALQAREWFQRLTDRQTACVNMQVLNEASHVMLRKKWFDEPGTVYRIIDQFAAFGDTLVSWPEVTLARLLQERFGYSWWDCLLLASAIELGCSHILSEDLQDGQAIGDLTIVDPFAHSPEQILSHL